jgi:hypothetical protein
MFKTILITATSAGARVPRVPKLSSKYPITSNSLFTFEQVNSLNNPFSIFHHKGYEPQL